MSKQLHIKLYPIHQVSLLSKQLKEIPLDKALCYGLECDKHSEVCDASCYLSMANKFTGLDYIVEKGYVTKAEALEFTLRLSK